ncbi:MAG: CAP domain-containing protein [Planctomycetota bacterium]|nr:CAP domain-containing protein [Planctomycetota bacterium]
MRANPLLCLSAAFALVLFTPVVCAQETVTKDERQLRVRCANLLYRFAKVAEKNTVGPRSRAAYGEILRHYDADHAGARKALGYRRTRSGWKPALEQPGWLDDANDRQRQAVAQAWQTARHKLGALHRQRGLAVFEATPDEGRRHLERAIEFDPFDDVAHQRLGHQEAVFGGRSYRGTEAQLQFVRNLRRLEGEALRLARKRDYQLRVVKEIPRELAVTGEPFHGASSANFTVFSRGTAEDVRDCVQWAERALEFLQFTLGADRAKQFAVVPKQKAYWAWQSFVWTELECSQLIEKNLRDNRGSAFAKHVEAVSTPAARQRFGNIQWFEDRRCREIVQKLTPAAMHDRMISSCWEIAIGLAIGRGPDGKPAAEPNWPLTEGALHAATWFLKSSVITQRGALPKGTSSAREIRLPASVYWWMRVIRDQAIAGTDMRIRDVVRKRSSDFPNAARLKAWSFMTFLMARYPKRWHSFMVTVPGDKVPFPEEVEEASKTVFDRPLDELEVEWRAWASGRSVTALASGYGEPVLSPVLGREPIAGLARLNEIRAQAGLGPCRLDAEATAACVEHARYLALHPEHHQWPAAHEQDPAKEGFTPRGMRCAMRSVIVIDARGAARSIDGWMGTIYHRLPLLSPNIGAVGFAYEKNMCVLDVGSLEGPPQVDGEGVPVAADWIVWPVDGATGVPRQFAFYELPNPLGDQPPPNNRDDAAGYPVSLTMAGHFHPDVQSSDLHLYRVKKRGAGYERQEEVRLHLHTPQKPLLARNQAKDTVFGIPFSPLARRTTYQAVASLRTAVGVRTVEWYFTTNGTGLRRPSKGR